ncbi:MAG: hypothetical protein ACR2PK_07685 [Acidimicrobiales bacterium]
MQHVGVRVGTATDVIKAVEATTEIASYARENLGWELRVGVNHTGPADQISVFSRNDSLEQLLSRRASVMTDPGMVERMGRIADLYEVGSAHTYILRPLFGEVERSDKELIYFRMVNVKPGTLGAMVAQSEPICTHLRSEHNLDVDVAALIGDGEALLWGVRFANGDEISAGFETTMADEAYNQMVAATAENIASVRDRIVRLLPA